MIGVANKVWVTGKQGDKQTVLFRLNEREKMQFYSPRLSGQTIHLWEGSAYDSRNAWNLPKRSTQFPSVELARVAFDKQNATKKAAGWKEITRHNYEGFHVGLPAVMDHCLRITLGLAKKVQPITPAKLVSVDHNTLLSRIVGGAAKLVTGRKNISVKLRTLGGNLSIPSGRLIAIDPFHLDSDVRVFDRVIPPGSYPVELSHVAGRIVAATIRVRTLSPARWELAIPRGKRKLIPPAKRDVRVPPAVGCAVDVATAAFIDEATLASLTDEDSRNEVRPPRGMGNVQKFGKSGSAAVFSTSGDGTYGVYFGMRGTAVVCVTMYCPLPEVE
jgi:hypothetical protein